MLKTQLLMLTLTLFSCHNSGNFTTDGSPNTKQHETKGDAYPIKELIIDNGEEEGWGADIRLSISRIDSTREMIIYTTTAVYKEETLGVDIEVSKTNKDRLTIKGKGKESHNLLKTLATLYNIKSDTIQNFVSEIRVSYIDLKEFAKDQFGNIDTTGWIAPIEYKLFFKGNTHEDDAELYLNINVSEHWLEFREKDPEYRPKIINLLTRK